MTSRRAFKGGGRRWRFTDELTAKLKIQRTAIGGKIQRTAIGGKIHWLRRRCGKAVEDISVRSPFSSRIDSHIEDFIDRGASGGKQEEVSRFDTLIFIEHTTYIHRSQCDPNRH